MTFTARSLAIVPLATLAMALSLPHVAHADDGPGLTDLPRGSYVVVDPAAIATPAPTRHGGAPHILFLNRCTGGETISPGNEDSRSNTSSILSFTVNFPEYPFGDGSWNEVVSRTRELYAPFNVQVTDVDPSPATHDEVIVCGNAASAGFDGAGGVAPFSCGVIPNAITYVFAETMGNNPEALAIVIGQESAHAWGLDHEYKCDDPMTYLNWCGDVQFQDGDYSCGEYSERACMCGGATQNSYQHILGLFGGSTPDTAAPVATITSPGDGAEYDSGADFEITVDVSDDVDVTVVTLYVNGQAQGSDNTAPFGPWPASDTPDGTYELYVEAEDFAGNVGTSDVVTVHVGGASANDSDGDDPSDGDPSNGDDDDPSNGDDPSDDSDGDSDASDDSSFDTAGALPPGYGGQRGAEAAACACTTSDDTRWSWTLPWCVALVGWRATRRRR
jgi:hypothetical protein